MHPKPGASHQVSDDTPLGLKIASALFVLIRVIVYIPKIPYKDGPTSNIFPHCLYLSFPKIGSKPIIQ